MTPDEELLARVRRLLAGHSDVAEKRMVGGRSFLVGGRMVCGVSGSSLMVRVGRAERERALAREHVRPIDLGGRTVAAYVLIDPPGFETDEQLAAWLDVALGG